MIWHRPGSARRAAFRLLPLVLALLVCGCARSSGNITGKVTYKGKPLAGCQIVFFDEMNQSKTDEIKADGSYSVSKVATGKAKIALLVPMNIQMKGMDIPGAGKAAAEKAGGPDRFPTLPAKYGDKDNSGLICEVKAGDQQHDITLE